MPSPQAVVRCGQLVMARIKKVTQHSVEVKIDEPRPLIEQERPVEQHFLKRDEFLLQACQQLLLPRLPFLQAAPPEFSLLMSEKADLFVAGNELTPINIV